MLRSPCKPGAGPANDRGREQGKREEKKRKRKGEKKREKENLLALPFLNGISPVPHRKLLQSVVGPDYGDRSEYLRFFINA